MNKLKTSGLRWIWITFIVLIADRFTKLFSLSYLDVGSPVRIFNHFNLRLAYNRGAAFSFLDSASGWQGWMFGVISIGVTLALLIWLYRLSAKQRLLTIALTLVMGGALGNLTDRIHYGYVIDFLDFYWNDWHFPTFNIADSAICIGAFLLLWDAVVSSKS